MAETIAYKRRRAKHPSDGIADAGKIALASADERNENLILYERRKLRKRQLDDVDQGETITLMSTDEKDEKTIVYERRKLRKKQFDGLDEDETITAVSTDKRDEKIIVYERKKLRKKQLDGYDEGEWKSKIATDDIHAKVIEWERAMPRNTKLTDLHEEILGSIVSCLPLREAVRTSILSTKLRHIWTCHPNLNFTNQAMFPVNKIKGTEQLKTAMIQGMQAVLQQHKGSGVERVCLKAMLDQRTSSVLNDCVKFAATSGAKYLSLLLSPERPYCFPTYLFDTRRGSKAVLEELYLKFVSLRIPHGFTGFTQLKRLELVCMYDIVADELQDLLKNCLLLQSLCINMLFKFEKLVFSQDLSNLKCLSLTGCHEVKRVEIAAPNLERFKYEGSSDTNIVFTQPLLKVRYASIQCGNFSSHIGELVLSVLPRTLPGLETIVWKTEGIEMDGLPNYIGKFHCLKTVQIVLFANGGLHGVDVLSFAALLDAAPLLKSFSLKLIGFVNHPYSGTEDFRKLPSSPHHHLKSVRIQEFTCSRDQIELVEYILENATSLENITIKTKNVSYWEAALNSTYLTKDTRVEILV